MTEPFILINPRDLENLTQGEKSVVREMLKRDPWMDRVIVLDVLRQMRRAREEKTNAAA